MRLNYRWLIPLDLALLVLAALGVLQAAAKDDTTAVEGITFWVSLVALPVLLIVLVALIGGAVFRAARAPAGTATPARR